jgi:hypothetical protein
MTLTQLIAKINYNLRGIDDDSPVLGDDEWNYWTSLANSKKDEWADDTSQNWRSNWLNTPPTEPGTGATTATTTLTGTGTEFLDYRVGDKITVSGETERTIATITSDTVLTVTAAFSNSASGKTFTHKSIVATAVQAYSVPRTLISPSDQVRIIPTTGSDIYYDLDPPQERSKTSTLQEVYLSGRNPQTMTFAYAIASTDQIVGGTLYLPGYYRPVDLDATLATDLVLVDDPNWLAMAVAAEVAFNDITYEDKYADLAGKASVLYKNMSRRNRKGTYKTPRVSATNVTRITGFR